MDFKLLLYDIGSVFQYLLLLYKKNLSNFSLKQKYETKRKTRRLRDFWLISPLGWMGSDGLEPSVIDRYTTDL